MNDTRNFFLAWLSSMSSLFTAIDTRDVLAIVSAIVLPVIFFTVGKTVDVLVQIYLRRNRLANESNNADDADANG